jgi:hypothetical protein
VAILREEENEDEPNPCLSLQDDELPEEEVVEQEVEEEVVKEKREMTVEA